MVGCGGDEGDDTGGSTSAVTTTQTTGTTDPQTGSTGPGTTDPSATGTTDSTAAPTSTTDAPTTDAPTGTSTASTTTDASTSTTDASTGTTAADDTSTGAAALTASATLEPKSGSMVTGTVLFTDAGGGMVDLVISVEGVTPPGTHGLHIHELPDCSAPDGTSTGNHWNPGVTMLGELGTIEIDQNGSGVFTKTDAWSISTGDENDVVDHSIIIHAEAGGGTRIACGVIAKD